MWDIEQHLKRMKGQSVPEFSHLSEARLLTVDSRLDFLFRRVITEYDCTVLCGMRSRAEQEEAFRTGHSRAKWGHSPHNVEPLSLGIDVAPYPIDWSDRDRFLYFGGYVLGVAMQMEIPLAWGGDWNGNRDLTDQTFDDLAHFEIRDWRNEI